MSDHTTVLQPPVQITTVVQPPVVRSTVVGVQGPSGPPGPKGDPGDVIGVADKAYTHQQMTASAMWTVAHNLGKFPSVAVFDSAGDECEGDIKHLDLNNLTISFSAAFGGVAYLN